MNFYEEVLSKWAFDFERTYVATNYGKTHIVSAGKSGNPPLILLHGAASNILSWGGDIPVYMEKYNVIAPDIPGDAGQSAANRLSWNNLEYIDWLDEFIHALNLSHIHILGISFGGWLAAKYAAHHKVEKIVLLTPGGIAPPRSSAILRTIWYSMQGKRGAAKMKQLVFGTDRIHPDVSRFFDLMQRHYKPRFGSPSLLSDSELAGIQAPLLMVAGDRDAFFPAQKVKSRLEKLVPRQKTVIIPEGEHAVVGFAELVLDFLRRG